MPKSVKVIVCIPARYESTRFANKVLAKDTGKFLIQHTYEQACKAKLPDAVLIDCSSTAEAARKTAEEPGSAAIASREAARLYNLKVLASKIEDMTRNITRFLVIGNNDIRATGTDKTSILFVTTHVPGSLFRVLKPIAESGINMVKLESRPIKRETWNYMFFLDIEGHMSDPPVKQTLNEMEPLCLYMKILGSYPKADDDAGLSLS